MLEIKNLSITTFQDREIIQELNLSVKEGDKLAVIGEEGNGKTTLIKCIYDSKKITSYAKVTGNILKSGLKLGYLEQFLKQEWDNLLVEEFFLKKMPEEEIKYEQYERMFEVNKIFKRLKIDLHYLQEDKKIGTLSGGEKVKMQLAKILLEEPDLLLLDEPTNDLDIETLVWLEKFILKQSIPVIFISHDEVLLENVANCILHLEQTNHKQNAKWTYEHIGYQEYMKKRKYLLNKQEQVAQNEKREYEKQMERFRQIYQKVESDQRNISRQDPHGGRLLKKKMHAVKSLENRLEKKELTQRPEVEESILVKFHNEDTIHKDKVVLDYQLDCLKIGDKELANGICLKVIGKEKVAIIGENGCGKTTLLKRIYKEMMQNGKVSVGYMPQNYEEELALNLSPVEFLKVEYTKEEETLARTYMGAMKFTVEEMIKPIANLSGGQRAKLFLVKLILQKNHILLLDEPTRNLSPLSTPVIRSVLRDFKGSIISVSHDRKYIEEVCSTVYELKKDGLMKCR